MMGSVQRRDHAPQHHSPLRDDAHTHRRSDRGLRWTLHLFWVGVCCLAVHASYSTFVYHVDARDASATNARGSAEREQMIAEARDKFSARQHVDGEMLLAKLLTENAEDDEVRYLQATEAFANGKDDLAILHFEALRTADAIARQKPTQVLDVVQQLVQAYAFQGELSKAQEVLAAQSEKNVELTAWADRLKEAEAIFAEATKEAEKETPAYQQILDGMTSTIQGPHKIGSKAPAWRELRAKANLKLGHEQAAFKEYEEILRMQPMSVRIMLELGQIKWDKNDIAGATVIWRECVKVTDDDTCRAKWKEAKAAQKEKEASSEAAGAAMKDALKDMKSLWRSHQPMAAFKRAEEIVTAFAEQYKIIDPADAMLKQVWPFQCRYAARVEKWDAVKIACQYVLDHIQILTKPTSADDAKRQGKQRAERASAYYNLGNAEAKAAEPDYTKALEHYEAAAKINPRLEGLQEALKKTKKLKKEQNRFDPYKALGVDRSASPSEIKKAFRKLSLKYHPDKAGGNETLAAELKEQFLIVNRAQEILSDPEKKAHFDQRGYAHDDDEARAEEQGGFPGGGFPGGGFPGGGMPIFFQGGGFPFGMGGMGGMGGGGGRGHGGGGGGGGGGFEQVIFEFVQGGGGGGGGPIHWGF